MFALVICGCLEVDPHTKCPALCPPPSRCLSKFPARSSPTASCLCSLNLKCRRSCPLPACAAAETWRVEKRTSPHTSPFSHKQTLCEACSAPTWPHGGSTQQHFRIVDRCCNVAWNKQYYHFSVASSPALLNSMTCSTLTLSKPGEPSSSHHLSVYAWPRLPHCEDG